MKSIFYTNLFAVDRMSIAEKIVYSYIAFMSASQGRDGYDEEGKFDYYTLRQSEGCWVDLWCDQPKIYRDTGLSRQTISNCIKSLRGESSTDKVRLIDEDKIYIYEELFTSFFELRHDKLIVVERAKYGRVTTQIYGWPLLVYSYLSTKAKRYGYVDSFREKLAKGFYMDESQLSRVIAILIDSNLVRKEMIGRNWRLYIK